MEEEQYNGRTPNGNYPVPIDDLVLNDGSTSEVTMDSYTKSETIVFYDLPLTDNYGTNTEMAIRGIELTGNVEQSDRITLYAKLQSPTGESRERSIVLDDNETSLDTDNTFTIGGNGDLWGFSTLDIVNLEDWEIELTATNTLEETTANLNYGNIQLNLYIEQVQSHSLGAGLPFRIFPDWRIHPEHGSGQIQGRRCLFRHGRVHPESQVGG